MTGKEIKQLSEKGFDLFHDGNPFPYVLTINEGTELDETQEYLVVICGYTKEVKDKWGIQDTQINGMDAIRDYLTELKTVCMNR